MDLDKWRRWKEAPPGRAKERLIAELLRENQNLAIKFIKRVLYTSSTGCDWEEAYQYGMIGLFEAFARYNPDRGYGHFSTVAWIWVRKSVQDGLKAHHLIKRPMNAGGVNHRKYLEIENFRKKNDRDPLPEEVGLTQRQWETWSATVIRWGKIKAHLKRVANRPEETHLVEQLHSQLQEVLMSFSEAERKMLLSENASPELMYELRERMLDIGAEI